MGLLVLLVGMREAEEVCAAGSHPCPPFEEKKPHNLIHTEAHCNRRVRVLSLALFLPKFLHILFLMQPPLLLQVGRHRSLCTVFCWLIFTQISSLIHTGV